MRAMRRACRGRSSSADAAFQRGNTVIALLIEANRCAMRGAERHVQPQRCATLLRGAGTRRIRPLKEAKEARRRAFSTIFVKMTATTIDSDPSSRRACRRTPFR